jgi:outer membrane lipoprotein-sorting protein
MTRVLAVALVALAAVALYAASAPAGEQAVTPKQFAALQKRVTKLETTNKQIIQALGIIVGCAFDQGAIPTTKTPQYHVTATGETTDFYVLTTNDQDCVDFINSPLARQLLQRAHR